MDLVTRFVPATFRTGLDLLPMVWTKATRAAADERRADPRRPALLAIAAWLDERAQPQLRTWLRTSSSPIEPIALSIGSHTHVDVGPIIGASLRHALVVVDPFVRRGALDVIDLASGQGLRPHQTQNQTPVARLQAHGAVRFGVGSGEVLAFGLDAGELVEDAQARALEATERSSFVAANARDRVELAQRADTCVVSVVTPTLPSLELAHDPRYDDPIVILRPRDEDLGRGFLIGRYPRCNVQTPADEEHHGISRVHAFVQRRGRDSLLIVDVGSTNGSRVVDDGVEHVLARGRRACVVGLDARLLVGGWCYRVAGSTQRSFR